MGNIAHPTRKGRLRAPFFVRNPPEMVTAVPTCGLLAAEAPREGQGERAYEQYRQTGPTRQKALPSLSWLGPHALPDLPGHRPGGAGRGPARQADPRPLRRLLRRQDHALPDLRRRRVRLRLSRGRSVVGTPVSRAIPPAMVVAAGKPSRKRTVIGGIQPKSLVNCKLGKTARRSHGHGNFS